ncbi:hypothetical protein, unlikely [Trypanosoma brucei gambiense DAL972]|uniref:Uncharacterized protein n=1 Tax=Trypanosoma brucei gambiense (strain MHOM/CI/86/DAL972) TaxID=679716 RepID=C9ZNE9_TRYB9|nr:hypothetical protein, unlikely [Trypanosoma brucei gambiense DAL972]CBH10927.1 hypothetical protein, unlikely [Trypanosoma brucei gambiense DAL972]|eukprot:XP_011773214.1 hypothetical protein, unlikely [Trypanosoma brucei gambiense DAL972]
MRCKMIPVFPEHWKSKPLQELMSVKAGTGRDGHSAGFYKGKKARESDNLANSRKGAAGSTRVDTFTRVRGKNKTGTQQIAPSESRAARTCEYKLAWLRLVSTHPATQRRILCCKTALGRTLD